MRIRETITEEFSYVGPKSHDMPGKNLVFPENWRKKNFAFQEKVRNVQETFSISRKNWRHPPSPARHQFLEKILILSHRSLGPIRRCSFVVFFKTPARPCCKTSKRVICDLKLIGWFYFAMFFHQSDQVVTDSCTVVKDFFTVVTEFRTAVWD
jgi:hypothetical protein